MLLMKAWLETRWRVLVTFVALALATAINLQNRDAPFPMLRGVLVLLALLLAVFSMQLAGSGVRSQAPIGFWEGLVGSTQFTISLPVTRLRLVLVRLAVGLLELSAIVAVTCCALWVLFRGLRQGASPFDMAALGMASVLLLAGFYLAGAFFSVFLDEPMSGMCGGFVMFLAFLASHHVPRAIDVFAIWGQASPLITHAVPWSQMAASAVLAGALLYATVICVRRTEY